MRTAISAGFRSIAVGAMLLATMGPLAGFAAPAANADATTSATLTRPAAAAERAKSWKVFWVGHSLLSGIPDVVSALVTASPEGLRMDWKEQNIPGAPLHFQWTEPERDGKFQYEPRFQARYDKALAAGDVDTVVLTDSVPRGGSWQENETYEQLVKFAEYAWSKNAKTRIFYYETWSCLDTGTEQGCEWDTHSPTRKLKWLERVEADKAMWRRIVARANAKLAEAPDAKPGREIRMLPGGPALAAAVREAEAGKLPGLQGIDDFFHDRIHANALGTYIVGCVHYATVTGRSPVGLPYRIKERWGRDWWTREWRKDSPPDERAIRRVQEIAWETVRAEPGAPTAK